MLRTASGRIDTAAATGGQNSLRKISATRIDLALACSQRQ
jgi:hypothetical protein